MPIDPICPSPQVVHFACSAQIPPASRTFQEAQNELSQTAAGLNQSAGEVVHASRGSSGQLAEASGKFSHDFDEFLDAGIEMAGHTQVGVFYFKSLLQYCHTSPETQTHSLIFDATMLFRKKMTRCR